MRIDLPQLAGLYIGDYSFHDTSSFTLSSIINKSIISKIYQNLQHSLQILNHYMKPPM